MHGRRLTILYGSQTGTAQDLAEKLYRESKMFHFSGPVTAMDQYDVENLINENIVLFVCSTTGQGEEPDNMKAFWRFLLRKSLPTDSLKAIHYAVLGLGDSGYSKFNYVAKRLNKRLQQLGGNQLIPVGLCDDQHDMGTSAVSIQWMSELWQKLLELSPLPEGITQLTRIPKQLKWKVTVIDEDKENNRDLKPDHIDMYEGCVDAVFDKTFTATVVDNVRTSNTNHFQDVRLIGLSTTPMADWSPGDIVMLRPRNDHVQVKELFGIFSEHNLPFFPETVVTITEFDEEMRVPQHLQRPLSLSTLASQYWNLNAVPRPRAFELLAINCDNELEKEKLYEFTTAEGQQDLFTYANRPRRTILEVLADFPHSTAKLTLPIVFELFDPIKPRSFSIASCKESGSLDLLVAVVEYKTILKAPRRGLCSNWLKRLVKGDAFRAVVKKGTFRLPTDNATPLIMVGPGTGLAPFRSILQHKQMSSDKATDRIVLFFGCRNEQGDFHCKEELRKMHKNGLIMLFTAFSRDQADKRYVQHVIKEQRVVLKELLVRQKGWFLLAGNSKNMPKSVREAVCEALDDDAYVEHMIKSGRYQEETWA